MQILTQLVYSGIALGMIYAVIAFGYQLTFATSDTLNFGQGNALMLGAMVGLTLVNMGLNYWLMIPLVCLFGAFQGAVVERIALAEVERIGGLEGELVAEGDDRVDHPEGDAAEDELGQDFHGGSDEYKKARPRTSRGRAWVRSG